jgi:hypothetical protein
MLRITLLLLVAFFLAGCVHERSTARVPDWSEVRTRTDVAKVLDSLHDAASKAQSDRYFALFAPDAVFLGTDAKERWTIEQFKAYALPLFAKGRGWTYTPRERHIQVSHDGWSWFDELLDNAKYGTCRGSGVLRQQPSGLWLIVQYDLSVPIPNDLLPDVAEEIQKFEKSAK